MLFFVSNKTAISFVEYTVLVKPNLQHICNDVLLYSDAVRNYFLKTFKGTNSNVFVTLLTG